MSREVFSLTESKTEVERPRGMTDRGMTDEDVKAHIKAIGEAIAADAERMNFRAGKTKRIDIDAVIAPDRAVTTVIYRIVRYADPRIAEKGEKEE